MNQHNRPAFTLFELLTLLVILALLLALLLPAVAKVRQAAERTRSQNNLKQIAISIHAYADVHKSFPPGNDANNFSAAAYLLPYVEQDAVFKQIDFSKPMTDKANAEARKLRIPTFLSPLDPLVTVTDDFGATNYLYSAGSKTALKDNDGIFFQESKIRFADVTDGLSNTMMVGETLKGDGGTKPVDVRRQYVLLKAAALKDLKDDEGAKDFGDYKKDIAGDRCASWMDGRFLQGTFTGTRPINATLPDISCGGVGGFSGLRSLTNGANIAMCDGSVRFVNQQVSLDVWKLLAGRNDGQVIPDF